METPLGSGSRVVQPGLGATLAQQGRKEQMVALPVAGLSAGFARLAPDWKQDASSPRPLQCGVGDQTPYRLLFADERIYPAFSKSSYSVHPRNQWSAHHLAD